MTRVSVQEAQATLPDLIRRLATGDEVIITQDDLAVARLIGAPAVRVRRTLGSLRGTVTHMASDFDAPLDDFAEYMK